jgi:hypothetical protein
MNKWDKCMCAIAIIIVIWCWVDIIRMIMGG